MIKTAFVFLFAINTIIFIPLMFGSEIISNILLKDTSFEGSKTFMLGIVIAFLLTLNNFADSLLNVQMKNTLRGILRISQSSCRYMIPIPFILLQNFNAVLYIIIAADAVFLILKILFSRNVLFVKGWFPIFGFLKKSFPLYITEMFNYGQTKIDVLLVNLIFGGDPFANYYIIRTVYNVLQQLTVSINLSFLPHMSERFTHTDKSRFSKYFDSITKVFVFFMFVIFLGSVTLTIPFLGLFDTSVTDELLITMIIMFLAMIPRILWLQVYGSYFASVELKPIPVLNLVFVVVNIGVELLFIYFLGLIGAAISIMIGYVFAFIMFYVFIRRKINIRINFRSLSLQTISALSILAPTIILAIFGFTDWFLFIEVAIIQIILYFALTINYLKEDIEQIIQLLPPKFRHPANTAVTWISFKKWNKKMEIK
ncbi:MAG: polysaccharide biosynthesis C-terminal domain-containing protein [Candidatus Heimdallarchaeota archaeon]